MYKVIGLKRSGFKGDDGGMVNGYNVFVSYEDSSIQGVGAERFYVADRKFVNGVIPQIGDEVDIRFSRYGTNKIESCEVIS